MIATRRREACWSADSSEDATLFIASLLMSRDVRKRLSSGEWRRVPFNLHKAANVVRYFPSVRLRALDLLIELRRTTTNQQIYFPAVADHADMASVFDDLARLTRVDDLIDATVYSKRDEFVL